MTWQGYKTDNQIALEAEALLEQVSTRLMNSHDWHNAIWRHDGHVDDDMRLVAALADRLDPLNLNALLVALWTDWEAVHRLGNDNVVRWFRRAGLVVGTTTFEIPHANVTAWRGTDRSDERVGRGLCWTRKESKAKGFSLRDWPWVVQTRPGYLWKATVVPAAILGIFNNAGEEEYVVDPAMLEDLELVELVPPPPQMDW